MQIAIDELELPVRLRTERPMSDDEFMRFSGANELLRMEQESNGDILTPEQQRRFSPLCPEFVIELRFSSDRLADVQAKMEMWLRNGVELAWLIDPERRVVEVYSPGRESETIQGVSAVGGDGPVSGFVLELARLWA